MLSNPLLDRYGPTLEEYLNPNTHGYELQLVTRRVLPSRQDILDAIALLSEPEEVTYQTFETILALEWSPACNNLDILVSGAAQTSLPACFLLITKYCEEGNHRVLDHAYGLLCFRVISLFVQFSIISRSDKLNLLFASNSLQPRGRSIAPEFNEFTCNVVSGLVSQSLRNRRFTGIFELGAFGWSVDPSTGSESCFPKLGGCPVDEVHNLFLLLWESRDKLLYVASRTAPLFPGLGGLICWVWSAIARQFDIDDRRVSESTWAYYLDLLIRFTLCSNEREAQLASLLYFACHKFGTIPVLHFETKNTVDAHDSARIGVETARKLDSDLNLPIDLATALIAYAGPNVDFGGNIVGIMKAAVERLCIELDDVPRAEDLSDSLIAYCEMCFFTLSKVTDHDLRALMQIFILVGEDIFEALGRILFIPISLSEPHSIGGQDHSSSLGFKAHNL
ncbi:unnamed protein product [Rhizoctonia solani]|uniref:Uncharacterized protein n=1 Tax=Rhizoctonia solani TaxID=456999 RepID=A0A8H3HY78_9AGAM|nr:unnamed protein product [Rhizoctonia solani]